MTLFDTQLLPYAKTLGAFGALLGPFFAGKALSNHWHHLDVFENVRGRSLASCLARLRGLGSFYVAVLLAPLFTVGLALWEVHASPETPTALRTGISIGVLLYFGGLAWFFLRHSSRAKIAQLDAGAETRKSLPNPPCPRLSEPGVTGAYPLQGTADALASAVLEREKTVGKVVDLEASEKEISPFLQGLLATSQDNLRLMLQRCPPQQPSAKSPDKDPTP